MSKIVTFTDSHIKTTTPRSRTDKHWLDLCLGQIESVFALANSVGASAVLCSGDLGHSPNWSYPAIRGFFKILKKYKDIQFITTVGQHDVVGKQIEDWDSTPMGLLAEIAPNMHVLEGGDSIVVDGSPSIEVYGFGFDQLETKELLEGRYAFRYNESFRIAIVHASVGAKEDVGSSSIESQNIHGCHVASFGDIHDGFDVYEFKSGTCAYSTGSLVRPSISDKGRIPACACISIEEDHSFDIDFYDMPDGDDDVCFVSDKPKTDQQELAAEFDRILEEARSATSESPIKRVQRIGQEMDVPKDAIDLVINSMELEQ